VERTVPCLALASLCIVACGISCQPHEQHEHVSTPTILEPAGARPTYRFDDNLGKAAMNIRRATRQQGGARNKLQGADLATWTTGKYSSTRVVDNGSLSFETEGCDVLTSPPALNISVKDAALLAVRMKVAGTNKVTLAWRGDAEDRFDESAKADVAVSPTGEWETYEIRVASLKGWSVPNTFIKQLQIAVPMKARIEIESVCVKSRYDQFMHQDAGVIHYGIRDEGRLCLFMHAPGEIRYRVDVFEGAKISTGLATVDPVPPVTFGISVDASGETMALLEDRASSSEWRDEIVDLSAYVGNEVDVVFKADCPSPGNIALWSSPAMFQVRPHAPEKPLNIVWYVVDALRADHLDVYGYPRNTAPVMRELAAEGARFTRCFSPSTWTKPSIASMLTGVSPLVHRIGLGNETLPAALTTLPEQLRNTGYTTASITQSPLGPRNGYLDRGFDSVRVTKRQRVARSDGNNSALAASISSFLDRCQTRPFFLLAHTLETHGPYWPPARYRSFQSTNGEASQTDLYDACVLWADANLGMLINKLQDLGLYDHTILIVTADHGQGLEGDEGGPGHMGKPYRARIHVPLLLHLPGAIPAGLVLDANVQTIDIVPTVLDLLGFPANRQFQGMTLLPLIRNQTYDVYRERSVFSIGECSQDAAMVKGNWFLFNDNGNASLTYLPTGPGQRQNLAVEQEALFKTLAEEMARYVAQQEAVGTALRTSESSTPFPVDADTTEQLKALGYLQ